jgi:LysR family transcriptional regulator, glycine cleavage system transcriptional activator
MKLAPSSLSAFAVLVVAARHQNFARAAEELGLTASAVSHHIRALESRLRVPLFLRHARGARLTPEGRRLADEVGAALHDIEASATSLSRLPRNGDRLRIATLHSLIYCWILPRLRTFTEAHPRVRLLFEADLAFTRFEKGGPDVAIRHGEGHWPGMTAHPLMDEDLFPAAAPGFAGSAKGMDAEAITGLPLVTDLSAQGWTDWFRAAGVRGLQLPAMHTFNDSSDALRAAAEGLGVVLARSRLVEPYLRSGELVRLTGPALKARFGYYAVHPSHWRLPPAAAEFVRWMRAQASSDEAIHGSRGPVARRTKIVTS